MIIAKLKLHILKYWKKHKLLTILICLIALAIIAKFVGSIVSVESFRVYIDSFGVWAPLFFISLFAFNLTIPILSTINKALYFAAILVFSPLEATLYVIIADAISTSINFYLARLWGYTILGKILKPAQIENVHSTSNKITPGLITVFRIIPLTATFADIVSYAAGISNMRWWKFIIATLAPWAVVNSIFFYTFNYFMQTSNSIFLLPWYWVVMFPVAYWILRSREEYKSYLHNFFQYLAALKHQFLFELIGRPIPEKE